MLFLSDGLMRCLADKNECLDLRRRAFAPGGQVGNEWSRCLGSMAWRARKSDLDVDEKGCEDESLWDAVFEAS